jgi:hypothetical protein
MDALTLAEIIPERCHWPCYLGIIAIIIIVLAAVKAGVRYFRNR